MPLKRTPKEVAKLLMVVIVVPAGGIHVPRNVLKTPKRQAEWEHSHLCPVNDTGDLSIFRIDENVHLAEVAMCDYKRKLGKDVCDA